eukprot:COSAG01_NODE_1899_length_8965_cov_3.885969_2_plen_133_part_00
MLVGKIQKEQDWYSAPVVCTLMSVPLVKLTRRSCWLMVYMLGDKYVAAIYYCTGSVYPRQPPNQQHTPLRTQSARVISSRSRQQEVRPLRPRDAPGAAPPAPFFRRQLPPPQWRWYVTAGGRRCCPRYRQRI